MIPREISGPQERFERSGAQALRDLRPMSTRVWGSLMSEFSGAMLSVGAGLMLLEPASVDLIVPAAIGYAALVLTRRVELPMRLPESAGVADWNYPDPKNRAPRMAAGIIYLGRDVAGRELWITAEDGRQHATIPGTTGAGKTTAILGFVSNALTHASGFVLVDGKADHTLFGEVMALARRFGREDDVLHLNLLVASGSKESNSFNPFATGNADAIREMVVSQLGEQAANDSNGVFRSRAVALIGAVIPVLTWIRDHAGIPIDIEKIRDALELRVIWKLAVKGHYELRDPATGKIRDIPLDLPQDVVYPLLAYLGELPGYDTDLDYNKQKSDDPSKQHGYARFYFTEMFTQLGVSLGHIFKVEQGDIDMRDVVLNRRILVVSLPALENSSDTLAGLGKIVVTSLRGMMAQMLGMPKELLGMEAPYHIVLDELAYYATSDLDRMMAQGRSLNIAFWLGFQEVSGIFARLGEKTYTLLGNANLTAAMRQQDANRTREWIEETSGKTDVAQATSFRGGDIGVYHDTRQADVRQVSRVNWRDLQSLIEGEAIMLFGGRRIYAKVFHAKVDKSGPKPLVRRLSLAPPARADLEAKLDAVRVIAAHIENGLVFSGGREPMEPTLRAIYEAFRDAKANGGDRDACVDAAIRAAGEVPFVPGEERQGAAARLLAMLKSALHGTGGEAPGGVRPNEPFDTALFEKIVEIEAAIGEDEPAARERAAALLGKIDAIVKETEGTLPSRENREKLRADLAAITSMIAPNAAVPEQPTPRRRVEASP
ncbi:type IV secretory system conjugative DNA transfer family protein [Methylosinus sp. RM1]|uniref:type IV secretory system conjugative DNA transfer family protein n=1 Tax=Methylosinus sp. RM1 TaxID=2583817 RepID=UPI00140C00E6|nr:TraM recognition domain-containing protein [Methylosinus sp. RM1]